MAQCQLARDTAATLADDDGHLALVVEPPGFQRPDHRLSTAHLTVGKAGKNHRMQRRGMSALRKMRGIVDANAEDFIGVWNGRQQGHVLQHIIWLLALKLLQFVERSLRKEGL